MIPRLHVVTDDSILAQPDFASLAGSMLAEPIALHIRAHSTGAARLYDVVASLMSRSGAGTLIVNDRVDIAMATGAHGVQLGTRSLGIVQVRALLKDRTIGYSAHSAEEAGQAQTDGADFILAGTIYPSESHSDAAAGGVALIAECARTCSIPVLAIGGVTPDRVPETMAAGAHGVAVIGAIWRARNPVQATREFVRLLES